MIFISYQIVQIRLTFTCDKRLVCVQLPLLVYSTCRYRYTIYGKSRSSAPLCPVFCLIVFRHRNKWGIASSTFRTWHDFTILATLSRLSADLLVKPVESYTCIDVYLLGDQYLAWQMLRLAKPPLTREAQRIVSVWMFEQCINSCSCTGAWTVR